MQSNMVCVKMSQMDFEEADYLLDFVDRERLLRVTRDYATKLQKEIMDLTICKM